MNPNDKLIQDFFNAVLRKNIPVLEELIKEGVDINSKNKMGKRGTALHQAADWLHLELAQWLIAHNADLEATDEYGSPPLQEVVSSPFSRFDEAQKQSRIEEMVQLLIASGANVQTKNKSGQTLLHSVVIAGNLKTLKNLLDRDDLVNLINVKDEDGNTPIHEAIAREKLEIVKLLVLKGADVTVINNKGQTLLHTAAGSGFIYFHPSQIVNYSYPRGCLDLVKYVFSQYHFNINGKDKFGCTPLHYAVKMGFVDTARFLLDQSASIDEVDNKNQTAFCLALQGHYYPRMNHKLIRDMVTLLISNGAKIDKKNEYEQTYLHCAVFAGDLGTVEALLNTQIGFNLKDEKDGYGITAAMYAEFRLKIHTSTPEIYEFFDSIQDPKIKESLFQSLPKPRFARDYSFFRTLPELQEMFDLFKNAEKVRCNKIQSNQWPHLFAYNSPIPHIHPNSDDYRFEK